MVNFLIAVVLILFAAFSRLIPHPMNFAPIAAIALFSGVYLDRKYAFIIPLIALVLSDIFLGFYAYIYWVYGSFLLVALIGLWLRSRTEKSNGGKKAAYIFGTTLAASIVFFLVTNFGVWTSGMYYEMNFNGLVQCYTMAIPFFRNSLGGDLFYVTAMFGIYELAARFVTRGELNVAGAKK
jgi:uncharacterized membrane protein